MKVTTRILLWFFEEPLIIEKSEAKGKFLIRDATLNAMLWLKKIKEKRSDFKWSALSTMTMLLIFNIFPIDKLSSTQRYWHGVIWSLAMTYFLVSTIVFGYQLGRMLKAKKPDNLLKKYRK